MRTTTLIGTAALATFASAQVPDLLDAFDAGGRAMGLGGATYVTDSSTFSAEANPAGLAFVTQPTVSLVFRNLPTSSTVASGDLNDPTLSTGTSVGSNTVSHVGYSFPLGRGSVGVSYTVAGFVDDSRTGDALFDGALSVRDFTERIKARTDFLTVAYGDSVQAGRLTWGAGLVVASQRVDIRRNYNLFDAGNAFRGSVESVADGTALGVGVVAGVQFFPSGSSNLSVGASIRSPISLSGDSDVTDAYSTVPGRASLGFAARMDRMLDSEDYLVYGAQLDYLFGGSGSAFGRDDRLLFGIGAEYTHHRFDARWPIRLGYRAVPSGGSGFADRNTLNFGLGWRPLGRPYSVDVNLGSPLDGGGFDLAVGLTYKLGG